jgi:type II secretory pathway pseudopilin PulG
MQTSGKLCRSQRAFSLIEVVIAVGIFAVSIVAVIGLLAPANKSVSEVRDADDTTRVVNAVQSQLQSLAETTAGFTQVAGFLQDSAPADPANGSSWSGASYTLYANRDGSKVALGTNTTVFTQPAQKYFEIVLIRNTALSLKTSDTSAGFLAFTMRIRWPAYTADGNEFTQHTEKSVLLVPAAVHR